MQFDMWRKIDGLTKRNRLYWFFIVILLGMNILLYLNQRGLNHQLSHLRLYITPAQVMEGGYYETNMMPKPFVYGFTYQMFIAINTWASSASTDYKKNIATYRYYVTPIYRQALIHDYQDSLSNGNLLDSVQSFSPYNGKVANHDEDVKQIGPHQWLVHLLLRVTRHKDGMVLMDALYDYQVRVVRTSQSVQYNPWGLALDGVVAKKRIKTFL